MKIEIGESLIYSWLRHVKGCQIVQINWKSSPCWKLQNRDILFEVMSKVSKELDSDNKKVFKGTRNLEQALGQGEIDAIGLSISNEKNTIFGIDIAFHGRGLNYMGNEETISRIIKKYVRTALSIFGYFNIPDGEIIFATPKSNIEIEVGLNKLIPEVKNILKEKGLNYEIAFYANEDFNKNILQPVLQVIPKIADTSELFIRSVQLFYLCDGKNLTKGKNSSKKSDGFEIAANQLLNPGQTPLNNMKIGELVRTIMTRMFKKELITREEIENMKTREYSKQKFGIQYPMLFQCEENDNKPVRYWQGRVSSFGRTYFLCSEWYETAANNDRDLFINWLSDKANQNNKEINTYIDELLE